MKQMIAVSFFLFISGNIFAQNNAPQKTVVTQKTTVTKKTTTTTTTTAAAKPGKARKGGPAIAGFILDARKHPLDGVQAFIYGPDSAIIASGYTDATGHYETNTVAPGKYLVKFVYPSNKNIVVTDVIIKNGIVPISISADEPASDTTMPFANFVPVADKKKAAMPAKKK